MKNIVLIVLSALLFTGCAGSTINTNAEIDINNNTLGRHDRNNRKTKDDIQRDITAIINKYSKEDIGIAFKDLTTGVYIGSNDDEQFTAASTIKVAFALYICKCLEQGIYSLEDILTYRSADYEGGSGIIQSDSVGTKYTLKEVLEYMIVYSDNIATNMIIRLVGYTKLKTEIGNMINENIDTKNNIVTSKQMEKFLELLYEKRDEKYYSMLVDFMKNTKSDEILTDNINKEHVARKIGEYGANVHDVGLFFEHEPYILSVYTNGLSNSREVISNISKEIYDYYKDITIKS